VASVLFLDWTPTGMARCRCALPWHSDVAVLEGVVSVAGVGKHRHVTVAFRGGRGHFSALFWDLGGDGLEFDQRRLKG
jgi:hypothetical protein